MTLATLLGVSALATPAADAQPAARVPRVGVLSGVAASFAAPYIEAGREGLRELGYVEGRNTWVDQFDTLGLGKDVPLATGNANESLIALVGGKFVNLRVPYPMGFYAKWMDGRVDDPNAGWKGKGLWSTYATRTPFHIEGGKGTTSKVVKFQLRPDPLAR